MTDFDVSDLSDDLGNGLGDGLSINAGSWVSGLSNTQRFKLLVACGLIALLSLIGSCNQLRYAMFGQVTQARVRHVQRSSSRRGGETLSVRVSFQDTDGSERLESFGASVSDEHKYQKNTLLAMQFVPLRPGASRPLGSGSWWVAAPLALAAGAAAVFSVQFWKDFSSYRERERRSLARSCP
ncbi:MAG: hypothetical protein ACK5ZG_06425 [Phycisphaerae bacterium]|jgi:hypothetical protein